jgi:hypothetical protein
VQAQGPQNFGQNSFSRTSLENYHDWNIAAQEQWTIGNNKINELRFQYARRGLLYNFSRAAGGSNVAVNIPGFAFFGREPFSFVNRTEERYQFTDNFSWSKGTHNIKFGVDSNFIPLQADFTVNFGGIYNFGHRARDSKPGHRACWVLSRVQSGAGLRRGNPVEFQGVAIRATLQQYDGGGFVQDSWRICPT